jgi:hypothetical protein
MMRLRNLELLVVAVTLALALPAFARVDARVDRQHVAVGEPLTLTLEARGAAQQAQPELDALAPDFQILGVSRGSRVTVINGVRDDAHEWSVVVAPTRPGSLVIPPLAFGAETTTPVPVEVAAAGARPRPSRGPVTPGAAGAAASPAELVFESRLGEPEAFVQEQVVLTVRLESPVALLEGQIHEPEIQGALVERLGEDRQETTRIGGRDVQVFERRYAVFPQRSGELEIAPFVFEGSAPAQAPARQRSRGMPSRLQALMGGSPFDDAFFDDFFAGTGGLLGDMGRRSQPVRASTDPIVLAVAPRPADATGDRWLPARDLEIVEHWDGEGAGAPVLRVGEPVDRVVTVRGRGVLATQLPEAATGEVAGLKQYEKPARLDSREDGGDMVASRSVPSVLIPTRPGPLTLPAVEVPWWDVEAGVARVASLPERTLEVLPASGSAQVAALPPTAAEDEPPGSEAAAPPAAEQAGSSALAEVRAHLDPRTIGIALLASGLVLASLLLLRSRRNNPEGRVHDRRARAGAERQLARACRRDDAASALAALTLLAGCRWPGEARSASELASCIGDEALEREVRLLLSSRYGAGGEAFSGAALWRAYRRTRSRRPRDARTHEDPLPRLYPSSR